MPALDDVADLVFYGALGVVLGGRLGYILFYQPSQYFADLALQAARRWKFTPAKIEDRAVASEWVLRFEFLRTGTRVTPLPVTP